jgi:hypothetical protein
MKQPLLLSILIFLFLIPCVAQSNSQKSTSTTQARKFDEYVYVGFNESEAKAELFAKELKKEPKAKAYIIAYDARISYNGDVKARGAAHSIEFFLDNQISPSRIVIINGGFREQVMVELFIVPPDATPPVPTPTTKAKQAVQCPVINVEAPIYVWYTRLPLRFIASIRTDNIQIKPIYKWSVSSGKIISGQGTSTINVEQPSTNYQSISATVEVEGFPNECKTEVSTSSPPKLEIFPLKFYEFGNVNCEEYLATKDAFLSTLFRTPNTKAYVMVYEGKLPTEYEYDKNGKSVPTKYLLPSRGEAKSRIRTMKRHLAFRRYPADKIVFVEAGFREDYTVEFWLVPDDSEPLKPTPTLKQMKYRKGKPVDFCGNDEI